MPLLKCTDLEGPEVVIEQDPAILTLPEVLYSPMDASAAPWGIFDHGSRLVSSCGYFRGPNQTGQNQSFLTPLPYNDITNRAPEDIYIYGGYIIGHYGHFLLSTLCRYWAFDKPGLQGFKILYHSQEDISQSFEHPFIANLFRAMELGPANFVRFTEPTRITRLIVPCPSFEETGFAHQAFRRLGHKLGNTLTERSVSIQSETPAYLSKAKVAHGVGHLVNEEEFSDALAGHGIDVFYPEQLSLAEQIKLFQSRSLVAALTGSSLHTSIFAPGRTIVGMSYSNKLYSSYTMIDRINHTQSHYVHPQNDIELLPRGTQFHLDYRLTDVQKTAGQFVRLLEMASKVSNNRTTFRFLRAQPYQQDPVDWPNIALKKPSRQSSFGPREVLNTPVGHISTATSGVLTGRYQFHTDHEEQPWWEVDLGEVSQLYRILIHNRSDNSQERAAQFVILTSEDGENWNELHRQNDNTIFGNGLEGLPFTWNAKQHVQARLVRIMLLGVTFLHLDQIEVFGIPQPYFAQRGPLENLGAVLPNFDNARICKSD